MRYYLEHFADRYFSHIQNPALPTKAVEKLRKKAAERELVQLFFDRSERGYFVDVGANHPRDSSQSWHLEQRGWHGVLIEPIAELCEQLRRERPRSITVQAACGAPEQRGPVEFRVADGLACSTLEKNGVSADVRFIRTDVVDLRTLDEILEQIGPPPIDFVSIDVEGSQLNVLRGFNLEKYRPRLLLVEDHLYNLKTHRYLGRHGYRLAKRTSRNSWYVPAGARFALTSRLERFLLWQKVWLRTPFRRLRRAWKMARKPQRPTSA
jgi:FkbM family methyltransferase